MLVRRPEHFASTSMPGGPTHLGDHAGTLATASLFDVQTRSARPSGVAVAAGRQERDEVVVESRLLRAASARARWWRLILDWMSNRSGKVADVAAEAVGKFFLEGT